MTLSDVLVQKGHEPWFSKVQPSRQRAVVAQELVSDSVSVPVREVIRAIGEQLFEPALTVGALKAKCRIRDNNFSARFKHETGVTIKGLITQLRLEAAKKLLQSGTMSAGEVGYAVGFAYPQTFYRAYKRQFGEAPGVMRAYGAHTTTRQDRSAEVSRG